MARAASSARHGEIEHVAAILHPKFGAPVREPVGGESILPSVKKKAAMGATLDIPIHHIVAMLVRSHFDAVAIRASPTRRRATSSWSRSRSPTAAGRTPASAAIAADQAVGEDGLR